MYGKIIYRRVTTALFLGLCLALVACQKSELEGVKNDFQSQSSEKLQRLSFLYSGAFVPSNQRAARGAATLAFPYGNYTYGNPFNYNNTYNYTGQNYSFNSNPVSALQSVRALLQNIPISRATYYFRMVLLARYLSLALHDQNFLMTWMSQQYGSQGLGYEGYNLTYPNFSPYQSGGIQQYSQASQYALQGYSEGQ